MKKWLLCLIFLIALFATFFAFPSAVLAEEDKTAQEELKDNVDKQVESLDTSELEEFINDIADSSPINIGGDVKKFLKEVINGEFKGGFGEAVGYLFQLLSKQILGFLPVLITITAIAVIFSIVDGMSSGFLKSNTHEIIYFVCYSAIIVLLITKVALLITDTLKAVTLMQNLMNTVFPILLTLMTALGGVVSVSAYKPMLAALSVGVVSVITKLVMPCFIAMLVFGIVGKLSKNIRLDKMTKFFKGFAEFVLGAIFSLFMGFVTVQGISGAMTDTVSVKTAKFAISGYVPILGGYLSDGFDLISASCVLVKNAVGVTGLVAMLGVILMPIVSITLFSLGLKLTAGIIEPLCDKRISELVYRIAKNINLLTVILLGTGFMFLITVMLIVLTGNMGAI